MGYGLNQMRITMSIRRAERHISYIHAARQIVWANVVVVGVAVVQRMRMRQRVPRGNMGMQGS